MSNRILVNPGTQEAWEIALKPGVNRIGRSAQNDFPINHPSLSSTHCEIMVSDAGVFLRDLGSKNGTFVNRSPVREVWLQPGQHLQFGAVDSIFDADQPATETPSVGRAAPGATVVVAAFGSPATIQPPLSAGLDISGFQPEPAEQTMPHLAAPKTTGRPGKFPVHLAAEREATKRKKFFLGVIGAVVGGLIGMGVWYFLLKSSDGQVWGIVVWGVGVVTGLGARLLARRASRGLGIVSALCALLAIVGGEYLAVRTWVEREGTKMANAVYANRMNFARDAVKAETPDQIRALLAGKDKPATEVTDAEIKKFQEEDLPELREFELGKPTRTEFTKKIGAEVARNFDYQNYFFKEEIKTGLFLVLFALLGVASAYKIASGEED